MALHPSFTSVATRGILTVLTACFMTTVAHGETSTFVVGATSWGDANSWASGDLTTPPTTGGGSIPDGVGDVAIFQQLISSNGGLSLNLGVANRTLGVLTVRDAALPGGYTGTLAIQDGGKTLIFDNGVNAAELNELGDTINPDNTPPPATDSGRLRITTAVQLNSDLNVTITHNLDKNTVTELANRLIGGEDITLTKLGPGSFQLGYAPASGSGEFFGDVDVQQGELRLINPNGTPNNNNPMLSASKGVYIHDGAQMQLGNHLTSWGLGSNAANPDGKAQLILEGIGDSNTMKNLTEGALRFDQGGTNPVTCDITSPVKLQSTGLHANPRIYVDAAAVTGRLMDVVRGDGVAGLNKGGNGVLKLMNADGNTYTGTTNISKGAVVVNNTNSATSGVGTGSVIVGDTGSGAALAGTGFIGTIANPVNVTLTGDASSSTGARLYPGDLDGTISFTDPRLVATSVGALTIHGDVSFDSLSSLNIDISHSGADQLIADGSITLNSDAGVGAGLNFNLPAMDLDGSESFTLVNNLGAGAINGIFGAIDGVAGDYSEGMPVSLGSQTYHITYTGGTGNDVVLLGAAAGVAGDYNDNGVVDAGDYVLWRKGGPLAHEVDNEGVVNAQDYIEWRARFGNPNPGSGSSVGLAAVPEPATIVLLALIFPFFAPLVARRKLGRTRS
jgi:autotransporter-associated beta strand protein